ncbi:MAG: hypothetical protein NVSMB17_06190 [Candidatus Dormibacteria bacterium]
MGRAAVAVGTAGAGDPVAVVAELVASTVGEAVAAGELPEQALTSHATRKRAQVLGTPTR